MVDRSHKGIRHDLFQIRRAVAEDAGAISDCLEAAFIRHRDEYTPEAYADTVLNAAGVLRRMGEMSLFVADSSGVIIGTVGCSVNAVEGHLRGMAVLPEWQGKRVASALLTVAEAELKNQGCACVTLDTTKPLLMALQFYENHGYSASGRVQDFFGMPLYEYSKLLL
jgi:GNAT superfamily N-acetyltransferase